MTWNHSAAFSRFANTFEAWKFNAAGERLRCLDGHVATCRRPISYIRQGKENEPLTSLESGEFCWPTQRAPQLSHKFHQSACRRLIWPCYKDNFCAYSREVSSHTNGSMLTPLIKRQAHKKRSPSRPSIAWWEHFCPRDVYWVLLHFLCQACA